MELNNAKRFLTHHDALVYAAQCRRKGLSAQVFPRASMSYKSTPPHDKVAGPVFDFIVYTERKGS